MTDDPSPAPARGWRIAAILSLTIIASAVAVNLSDPYAMDFISYWAAAKLALAGDAAGAYDIAVHHAVQARAVAQPTIMPFPYPPSFLFVLLPFGALPFGVAAALWIGLTLALYARVARRFAPRSGAMALAFPPVVVCGVIGQNAFLTAALFMGGLLLLPKRPVIAGLAFACLAIKPQLGVLLPLAFIAGREWRAFAGASIGLTALALAALAAFGVAAWAGFLSLMPLYGSVAAEGLVGWHKMASVYASLMLAGAPVWLAAGAHIAAASAGALLVWRVWHGSTDMLARGAALAIGTVLISPYLYVYDQLMLIVALAYLLRSGVSQGVIAALMLTPLITLLQTSMPDPRINLAPLLPVVLLVLSWRRTGERPARPPQAASIPA